MIQRYSTNVSRRSHYELHPAIKFRGKSIDDRIHIQIALAVDIHQRKPEGSVHRHRRPQERFESSQRQVGPLGRSCPLQERAQRNALQDEQQGQRREVR